MDDQDYRELVRQVAYEQARCSSSSFFFTGEDALRVVTFNSAAGVVLSVEGRFLTAAGLVVPFQETHTPNTDRSIATSLHRLGDGFLLNVRARASSGTPRRGQCFVMVDVVRGSGATIIPLATLLSGYCEDTIPEAWPGAALIDSIDGPGVIRSITGTDPAAGAEISETVPTNARWALLVFGATLTTSAVVANRQPRLIVDDGVNTIFTAIVNGNETAGNPWQNYWSGFGVDHLGSASSINVSIPPNIVLVGGYRLRTVTAALDVGDNWGAPQLLVEEWIED